MFLRNRPVGRSALALLVLTAAMACVTVRPAVGFKPQSSTAAPSGPTMANAPGVIAATRFISNRYRVPPARARQIARVAFRVSREHRLDPYLVLAVIAVESSFRPGVVNHYGGAYGLMQIAVRVHERRVAAVGGRRRLFRVAPNIRIGVALLAQYGARVRSQVRHALWRYSGGEYGYARKVLRLSAALRRRAEHL